MVNIARNKANKSYAQQPAESCNDAKLVMEILRC